MFVCDLLLHRRRAMSGAGAPQPAENPAEPRRIALNGQTYTWQEFFDYYGNDASQHWQRAYDCDAPQLAVHAMLLRSPRPSPCEKQVVRS